MDKIYKCIIHSELQGDSLVMGLEFEIVWSISSDLTYWDGLGCYTVTGQQ